MLLLLSVISLGLGAQAGRDTAAQAVALKNPGTTAAVEALVARILPEAAQSHFVLNIDSTTCGTKNDEVERGAPLSCLALPIKSREVVSLDPMRSATAGWCVKLEDTSDGKISLTGTTAAELTYGVGHYLTQYCNMSIGWKRGGGSNLFVPKDWPKVGGTIMKKRNAPWSYIMNVCTHSYSLVWYSWEDWQEFIDWMALSGINLYLAMTGQEEVQYKVFEQFGLNDTDIRSWFNGPAFLTWSRGQNEYGNKIAGPLPRSWMKSQWSLQKQILERTRSLGMSGQLPGFQGNVPIQLKTIQNDNNITKQGDTGWMNSVDPLYGKISDVWMKTLIEDFGTDHWYQLDGYFNGGTAPWLEGEEAVASASPTCEWSTEQTDSYLGDCPSAGCTAYATLAEAEAACLGMMDCGGVTKEVSGDKPYQVRSGETPQHSPFKESAWYITNILECRVLEDLPGWVERGAAAYSGLNRTDPDAIWSFQGWAFIGWSSSKQAASLKSFIDATPEGKFNVIDMSTNGEGEWKKWNNASFWGANYVWTTLHDFGGTDGLKGDLGRINRIPFDATTDASHGAPNNVWGTGFTPEGIDQNPVYYEFMLDTNWRDAPVDDITGHIVLRSHRRYGLTTPNDDVTTAWSLLVESAYAQDLSVQDGTGVPHLGSNEAWSWEADLHTPTPTMCNIWTAWSKLISAASAVPDPTIEPFRYDLVNTGREVLAQIAGPAGKNFTAALGAMDAAQINATGQYYAQVLNDVDTLVGTDTAFMIGPWLEMAKKFDDGTNDCTDTGYPTITNCVKFYEWNARVQLTTWNPTPKGATQIPGGPIDYASKHWSGLISDYYAKRVTLLMDQAIKDAASHQRTSDAVRNQILVDHAYNFTTATNVYPTEPVGDAVQVSQAMHAKYASFFTSC